MAIKRPQGGKAARPPTGPRSAIGARTASCAENTPSGFSVVGIGASAGGLNACRNFLTALPPKTGMAFILVQHLDPTHESMMVELLSGFTAMPVLQATDNMHLAPEHLYLIPPGQYLSVKDGILCLTKPQARHGARLPFDYLLRSLGREFREHAIAVVLSGTGADGCIGLKTLKELGGLVLAQEPSEAEYDGMPQNAVSTGVVDFVLKVADMPAALLRYSQRLARTGVLPSRPDVPPPGDDWFPAVIELLQTATTQDFRLYKPGTLRRRIERRMAISPLGSDTMKSYLELLSRTPAELDLLAKDLLINVTSFFRDPKVFDYLAETLIPDLIARHSTDKSVRIWIAGCSTGEEAYSLAILLHEHIAAAKTNIKLQIFASDIDADAVACARDGIYPETIKADVNPERLERYFILEENGFRVAPHLREMVIFTVQDVLADPPFSRLDLISCRNLLIYLRPEAQLKIISLFHFALRDGGMLLLGGAETVGAADDRFTLVSKPHQIYRQIGQRHFGDFGLPVTAGDTLYAPSGPSTRATADRQAALAERCRQLVLDGFTPAAVLINQRHECVFMLGPTQNYLRVVSGHATHSLMAAIDQELRTPLRVALQRAVHEQGRVTSEIRYRRNGNPISLTISVEPVSFEDQGFFMVCFSEQAATAIPEATDRQSGRGPTKADLARELVATKAELQATLHSLEISHEEQKAISEEALSVSEEFQSTNEELLTSKEELQSLNEELTALNGQLQETLERQRSTSNDLQSVLYSTDVATLFLDADFNIRFFTPATKSLFSVIPTDVGRPLADLRTMVQDVTLLKDAARVLETLTPMECEVEANNGVWYARRILPYRNHLNGIEGVVITFIDISERRHSADILEAARQQADRANTAKSRFLAAASHDLRQPLQTLVLLQGLLAKSVEGEQAQTLIKRLDETLGAMSGILNALLDINQIEAGTVHVAMDCFPVDELLRQLSDEFSYHAGAKGLKFRTIPCSLTVQSDPRLLGQMLRNILSNAVKYTRTGKILFGCRRMDSHLNIEVWDTGPGIPDVELDAIFEEYHQLGKVSGSHSPGMGLGLAIVQRLGHLLDHPVRVRSRLDRGSTFTISVPLAQPEATTHKAHRGLADSDHLEALPTSPGYSGTILVLEDDPAVRELLHLALTDEGYRVIAVADCSAASRLSYAGDNKPDLILADYNLPDEMNGLQFAADLRAKLRDDIPVIILTGDISTATLQNIARHHCHQLNKPVKTVVLSQAVREMLHARRTKLPGRSKPVPHPIASGKPLVFVVDDDRNIRQMIKGLLEEEGLRAEMYASSEAFLAAYRPGEPHNACLLIDARLPDMDGLELLTHLHHADHQLPAVMFTGCGDVKMAVQAMKAGASDFIEKPAGRDEILSSVKRALDQGRNASDLMHRQTAAAEQISALTPRQRQIMELVLAGHPNKNIAADLGISQRTVENHRASVMKRTGATSLPALARLAMAAGGVGDLLH